MHQKMLLCKEVHELAMRHNGVELQRALKKMMMDKVTINLNIYAPFAKYIIMSKLNSTLVVVVYTRRKGDTHVL